MGKNEEWDVAKSPKTSEPRLECLPNGCSHQHFAASAPMPFQVCSLCPAVRAGFYFCPAGFFFPPCAVLVVPALEACALHSALQVFFSALCSPGSFRPGSLCPAEVSVPALLGLFSALQGILSCPAGFFSCPTGVSFLPCRVSFLPCGGFFSALPGFLFHPAQAPCAGFSLCRVLLPPCAGFFSTRCRIPFSPCAGFLFHPVPCAGFFFHPVQGSFSTLRRHPVQGFFPALLGFLFCPAEVSFLPC